MLEGLRESLVLITALVSPDSMLSLVSLNSEFERNENIANARAIYHSQTAKCKAVPASRLSVLCAERERSVLWLSRVSDAWSDQSQHSARRRGG